MKKYAIVTGASTGIGRAVALSLSNEGYFVACIARRKDKLEETKRLIKNTNGEADIFLADLSGKESISNLIKKIKLDTNSVDLLVNVAGIWHGENEVYAGKDFIEFSETIIYNTITVGLLAPILLSQAVIPLMNKDSVIINLSGTFEDGGKGWLPYYTSKRALEDLTIGLAQEVEDSGIKIIGISPSDVATEEYQKYFPEDVKDALTPEEIANNLIQLSKTSESGKIWVLKKGQENKIGFHF